MFYVNKEKCMGCGKCASVCPQGAISIVNEIAVIDYSKCIECGTCSQTCPHHAIDTISESDQQIFQNQNTEIMEPSIGRGKGLGMGRGHRDRRGRGKGGGGRRK